MALLAIILIAAALAGCLASLRVKREGLGGPLGSSPDGPVVAACCILKPSRASKRMLLIRYLVLGSAALLVIGAGDAVLFPADRLGGTVLLEGAALALAAFLFADNQDPPWRPAAWALCGYLIGAGVAGTLLWVMAGKDVQAVIIANGLSAVAGLIGATAAVALMAPKMTFARKFESGRCDILRLSSRGSAAAALRALDDGRWEAPADLREQAQEPWRARPQNRR